MQIAVTLAVLISKIARIDYPKEWYVFTLYTMTFPDFGTCVLKHSIGQIYLLLTELYTPSIHKVNRKAISQYASKLKY